jgi:peptidoglycan/LPS O-acetylase OafA/YrhL
MSNVIYFKGLNGIRAIAALIVVVWHTDQFSYLFHLLPKKFYLNGMANRAVDIFFVLSGFLITFLLLSEKEKTNTIDIRKFYLRRILRIWPLYYLIILISIVLIYFDIIPQTESIFMSMFFYIFLMANISYLFHINIPSITPLWSVGIEEQFYMIWPTLVKKTTHYFYVFLAVFIGGVVLRIVSFYLIGDIFPNVVAFLYMFRINIMALGALGAFLYYTNHKWLSLIYDKNTQIVAWLVLIYSVLVEPLKLRTYVNAEINAVFYLLIILNVATNPKTIISLENKMFNTIGRFSYGIYVYHMSIIYVVSFFLDAIKVELNYYLIQLLILGITFIISKFSYQYIESRFLRLKHKFTVIGSTNQLSNEKL